MSRHQAILAAALIGFGGGSAPAAEVDGLWRTEPRGSGAYITVRIGPCPGAPGERCGTIAGAHQGARPDIVGERILRGLSPEDNGRWSGGEIIRPGRGDVYRSSVKITEGGLEVTGCALGGLFCRSQTWTRVR